MKAEEDRAIERRLGMMPTLEEPSAGRGRPPKMFKRGPLIREHGAAVPLERPFYSKTRQCQLRGKGHGRSPPGSGCVRGALLAPHRLHGRALKRRLEINATPAWLLVRSRPVLSQSPKISR